MKSAKQLYLSIKQLQFNKEIMRQSYEIKRKAVIFSRKEETDSRNNRVSGSVSQKSSYKWTFERRKSGHSKQKSGY